MSSKARHNEILRRHKSYSRRKKERLKLKLQSGSRFMFQEFLVNCEDAISLMIPAHGRIYRLAHYPNKLIDSYPTSLWEVESMTVKHIDLPNIIPAGCSIEKQQIQLKEYTPSFNVSEDGAVGPFIGRLEKMKTYQQLLNFKHNKGSHIYAYDVTPDDGRMWVENDGHIAFQPYEGFKLEQHQAKDFQPVPIENYTNKWKGKII